MLTVLKPHVETVVLRITPLTPIHIGCGIDFDPTGYVIDDGVLFHFDAAQVPLSDADRRTLLGAVQRPGAEALLGVQRFFHERSAACIGAARLAVPVAAGVAAQYAKRIGKAAQMQVNALIVERTSHHPHTGTAYLPGSSLKGAMRTAWLDTLNRGAPRRGNESASQLEKRLLKFDKFETDPFRLVRVSDAQGDSVAAQVYFSVNQRKRQAFLADGSEKKAGGPPSRRECLAAAQFGALECEVAVTGLHGFHGDGTPDSSRRIDGWNQLAAACKKYYWGPLNKELDLLEQRVFANPSWTTAMRRLLRALEPAMDSGDVMLLRAGRHSGAENVTLNGVRAIDIRNRGKLMEVREDGATSIWLAAHDENARSDMQPFGWLLLHREGVELPALQAWCAAQAQPQMAEAQARLAQAREQAQRDSARAESERQAAAQAAQRLQALSPEGRAVADLEARLMAHTSAKKQATGGTLWPAVAQLIAASIVWPAAAAADRIAFADLLTGLVQQKIDLGGKAKDVKQAAARLRAPTGGTP